MEKKLIANGVLNLQKYGYPDCNKNNILTDLIYSGFFKSMLKETKDDAQGWIQPYKREITEACESLLAKIAEGGN
jgi:hypothetical protein